MVFPALAHLLGTLFPAAASVPAKGMPHPAPGILAAYHYEASEPSLEKVYVWAKKTIRRVEPVRLDSVLVMPVCFSAGRREGLIFCTLTVALTQQGYQLKVTDAYHRGNGWVEDRGFITEPTAQLEWQLTLLRHSFEEWLAREKLSGKTTFPGSLHRLIP